MASTCIKCGGELPDGAIYCCWCGRKQVREYKTRTRGNGEGSVYKLDNGKYKAVYVTGYTMDYQGKQHRHVKSKTCSTKKAALEALQELKGHQDPYEEKRKMTFKEVYEAWLPLHSKNVKACTMDCYRAAFKYYYPLYNERFAEIGRGDLQECIDECEKGRRTKENMKALGTLLYNYAIPEKIVSETNIASYLTVKGESGGNRDSFTDKQIEAIKKQIGRTPYADYVYIMIYTGFRVSEFLSLTVENYNREDRVIVGGGKTAAGTDRRVTLSPKIVPYVNKIVGKRKTGIIFGNGNHEQMRKEYFTSRFYAVLEAAGIDNPVTKDSAGQERHKYTTHSCRHTFADKTKYLKGIPDKVRKTLVGHANIEQTKEYEDVTIEDLRKITDFI